MMVTSRSGIAGGAYGAQDAALSLFKTIISSSSSTNDKPVKVIRSEQTSLDPLNEFTNNQKLISGAFPHLFPLGFVTKERGTISRKEIELMLRQFTNVFSDEQRFAEAETNPESRCTNKEKSAPARAAVALGARPRRLPCERPTRAERCQ
jgi:hypothetical protein